MQNVSKFYITVRIENLHNNCKSAWNCVVGSWDHNNPDPKLDLDRLVQFGPQDSKVQITNLTTMVTWDSLLEVVSFLDMFIELALAQLHLFDAQVFFTTIMAYFGQYDAIDFLEAFLWISLHINGIFCCKFCILAINVEGRTLSAKLSDDCVLVLGFLLGILGRLWSMLLQEKL